MESSGLTALRADRALAEGSLPTSCGAQRQYLVQTDNEASDGFTIIEVFTEDRIGSVTITYGHASAFPSTWPRYRPTWTRSRTCSM
jgi:hypothetical protein